MNDEKQGEKKERPHIKPPELRPRPPRTPARPNRSRSDSRGGSNRGGQLVGAARTSVSKFGNGQHIGQFLPQTMPAEKGNPDAVRFVPLGGLEEVGRNCMFFEYKNEIVLIDVGLQFPEDETPGIDYIIPNTQYLESKKQNIQAIILTHGHYDHIGALPHLSRAPRQPADLCDLDHESDYRKTRRMTFRTRRR